MCYQLHHPGTGTKIVADNPAFCSRSARTPHAAHRTQIHPPNGAAPARRTVQLRATVLLQTAIIPTLATNAELNPSRRDSALHLPLRFAFNGMRFQDQLHYHVTS